MVWMILGGMVNQVDGLVWTYADKLEVESSRKGKINDFERGRGRE